LADEILGEREIEVFVRSWTMIPSSGGRFEVTVNSEAVGRHAEPGEIRTAILLRLEALRPGSFSASSTS
jgi:hypothetical protein